MKNKKIIILLPVIIFFFTGICFSQSSDREKNPPDVRAREMTDKLNKKLMFTGSQDSLVYNAYLDFFNSLNMLGNYKSNDDEAKKVIQNARNELDTKMKNILTSDQYDSYSSMMKEVNKKRGDNNYKSKWKNKD